MFYLIFFFFTINVKFSVFYRILKQKTNELYVNLCRLILSQSDFVFVNIWLLKGNFKPLGMKYDLT